MLTLAHIADVNKLYLVCLFVIELEGKKTSNLDHVLTNSLSKSPSLSIFRRIIIQKYTNPSKSSIMSKFDHFPDYKIPGAVEHHFNPYESNGG